MNYKFIAGIILGVLFLIFLLQNTQVVSLQLFFWKLSMSRIIFFPLMMLIGFVVGFLVGKKSEDWTGV